MFSQLLMFMLQPLIDEFVFLNNYVCMSVRLNDLANFKCGKKQKYRQTNDLRDVDSRI